MENQLPNKSVKAEIEYDPLLKWIPIVGFSVAILAGLWIGYLLHLGTKV